tara:strand:+ start:239 stop:538 length:300 start_codon:yes stop_codon:yes gene_type:complete
MARTKGPAYKMKSAAYGGPMRRNFPSAFRDEKTKKVTEPEIDPTADYHEMTGYTTDDGSRVIDEKGNYVGSGDRPDLVKFGIEKQKRDAAEAAAAAGGE